MTDEKRLFRAIRSDRKDEPETTFQYLYAKYKPLVSFVVAQYIQNRIDVEDITQETFVNFFSHVENVHSSIKTYLTASAKHIAFNFLKKNTKVVYVDFNESPYTDDGSFAYEQFANDSFLELINDMKKVISEEDIQIILLHLVDDVTFAEIASRLNLNVKTVKTKYYRALKKYKKARGVE